MRGTSGERQQKTGRGVAIDWSGPLRGVALAGMVLLAAMLITLTSPPASASAAYADDTLKPIGAGATGTTSVTWNAGANEYVLQFTDGTETVKYTIPLSNPNVQTGLIAVKAQLNSNTAIYPINWGGARYRNSAGTIMEPYALAAVSSVSLSHSLAGSAVTLTYTDTYQSVSRTKAYRFTIEGKTLVINITAASTAGNNNYAGVNIDRSNLTTNASIKPLSYAEDQPSVMVDGSYFYSTTVDAFQSHATSMNLNTSVYDANSVQSSYVTQYDKSSAGTVGALDETYYLTLSGDILDTAYKTSKSASPYRAGLEDFVALDVWMEGSGYGDDKRVNNGMTMGSRKALIDKLHDNWGMDQIFAMDHQWQNATYDVNLPVHYPANPMSGTGAEYAAFISKMKSYGWLAGVHEDYWYMYPDASNKYYDATGIANLAKDAAGNARDAWYMGDFGVMTKAIRAGKMMDYFSLESPSIASNYAPNASYLDVNSAWRPDTLNQITMQSSITDSRTVKDAIVSNKTLFDAIRDAYDGPLAGEGGNGGGRFDSSYAGYVDAVERELTPGTADLGAEVIVDYELKHIRPLMANQGMGYYSRFFPSEAAATASDWDKYYAMTIAFGHTGLMTQSASPGNLYSRYGKMYYMTQALQAQYLDPAVNVSTIEYWNGSAYRTLSQAMKDGYDFTKSRIHIAYSNGLHIYVNFSDTNWTVTYNSVSYTLNKNGWVAGNSGANFLEYSSLVGGQRVDYVDTPSYTYADARGASTTFPTFTTEGQRLVRKGTGDSTAPAIRQLKVIQVSDTSAIVTWTTDENSSESIEYGTTTGYGSKIVPSLDFEKTHRATFTNLTPNTTYHFRVHATDIAGNASNSMDYAFVTRPAGTTASSQFSSMQGANGWSYQAWNGSAYANLGVWDATNSIWKDSSDANAFIGSTFQHPGSSIDTARKWVASSAGWYQVSGTAYRTSSESPWSSTATNDGLNLAIKLNQQTVWSKQVQAQDSARNRHDLALYLNVGDALYFVVNKSANISHDGVNWEPSIIPLASTSTVASTAFSGDNGKNGWYARTWDGSAYREMTYAASTWSEGSASISSNWVKPSTTREASRVWVATSAGQIRVSGNVKKKVTGGDGVSASVRLNGSQVLWTASIGANDTTGANHDVYVHVEPGDFIELRVASGATATSDDTTWDPTIALAKPRYSVDDFHSVQGTNGWSYQKWDGSSYSNLTWNTSLWELAGTYLAVDANNMHPESSYDAVRKWIAPNDGRVTVYGTIQKATASGDGVVATALLNSTSLWTQTIGGSDTASKAFSYDVTVQAGDVLYFRLNRNATISSDTTAWKVKVEYERQEYDAAVDFSSVQGRNGWSNVRRNGATDTALTWSTDHWQYSTYLSIYPTTMHPESSDDAVRKWVAPFSGTVRIQGVVKVNSSGGDGIVATIKQNSSTLWSRTVSGVRIGYLPDGAFAYDVTVQTTAGDTFSFVLNKNATLSNDASTFHPTITYVPRD